MGEYVLSCESTADLTQEKFEEIGVEYIPFHFFIDDVEYSDDLGQTVSYDEFYQRMADGAETKTAAIGSGEYEKFFRSFLDQGKDVLHVSLSTGLSSTYESACMAAEALRGEYPDRKIYVVDSLGASSGYGLIMATLSKMRAEGVELDDARDWVEKHKLHMHHEFFSTDLTFYVRGGRVKPAAGFVGNLLKICPLLDMDAAGHLVPREKVRTKPKVIKRLVEKMEQTADKGLDYDGPVFLSQSACIEDARAVVELIKERFKKLPAEPEIYSVGTTIGSHTGPGTVALFFWGTERV